MAHYFGRSNFSLKCFFVAILLLCMMAWVKSTYFQNYCVQQGLEIHGFWFQKKTVQHKTVLREVYTYVLNDIFFQKTVYLQGFSSKSVFHEVTPMY